MKVRRLLVRHFRGFEEVVLTPSGHVALVGEPGAGRSDIIEALERVLWAESTRLRAATDLDFFERDTATRAEVEVVLGDLGDDVEQRFFDHLELWDHERKDIVADLGDPELADRALHDLVVRLCYRIRWNPEEEQPEHWVDYPKSSLPEAEVFVRVPRGEREAIPFAGRTAGQPLDLKARGVFRRLVEQTDGDDFGSALEELQNRIEEVASGFSRTAQISGVLESVLEAARVPLGLGSRAASEVIRFLPEGGSLAGLLRSLGPAADLGDGGGLIPLHRHGSTVAAIIAAAQSLAAAGNSGIAVFDDFGEGLNAAASQHLAASLRRTVGHVWLSTRRPHVVEAFEIDELTRLARSGSGHRVAYCGKRPVTRPERLAARHLSTQLLPAIASRAVIVVEGPHDRSALAALARRLHDEQGIPLPAAHGITLLDAGTADASGGTTGVTRLTRLARHLGFRAVALMDHDGPGEQAEHELAAAIAEADAVVRLPPRHAIEKALVAGLPEAVVRAATNEVAGAFRVAAPREVDLLSGDDLLAAVAKFLKQSGGLHAQFVEALPADHLPPLATRLLDEAVGAANGAKSGHIQL